jgi:hypothetical protein
MIYKALGMPVEMLHVMLAIRHTSSWIAQWLEMVDDPEQKIARPRQIYTGPGEDSISRLRIAGSFAFACATNDPAQRRSRCGDAGQRALGAGRCSWM